ncbi:hypothetical protein ACJZL1_01105 [Wolbachia endosymbiont of Rhagoletis indifferens]|uniref:hypothetical protein n=1 Tax=Wolbachia endosymbiont of Rhagoletis indifferens TaxID=3383250 RepID=UPI003AF35201
MVIIMDLKKLKNLQQDLLGIIFLIVAQASEEEVRDMQDRALKIIDELRDHINDDIEINDNLRMTILDCIVSCDSQNGVRLNNRSLLDLEDAVKSIGGKTSQELGRVREVSQQEQATMLFREIMESRAELIASMQEERRNRILGQWSGIDICRGVLAISAVMTYPETRLGESEVGNIVTATLGGLLSIPYLVLSRQLRYSDSMDITTSREIAQRLVHSISEPMAGLSAALAGGMVILGFSITRRAIGINVGFQESLRSGLIAAAGAGIGAALSTALVRRALAPVSTNLEDVATEQPNMQEQNR